MSLVWRTNPISRYRNGIARRLPIKQRQICSRKARHIAALRPANQLTTRHLRIQPHAISKDDQALMNGARSSWSSQRRRTVSTKKAMLEATTVRISIWRSLVPHWPTLRRQ